MRTVGRLLYLGALLAASSTASARADDPTQQEKDLFETHVRPVLTARCISCHGDEKQEGGLRLATLEDVLQGGDSGAAITQGEPGESLLLEAIRHESFEMPPDGKLPDKQIAGIEAWLAAGAPWPADAVIAPPPTIDESDRQWWCYQPILDPPVPQTDSGGWCRNEIDRFVYAKLAEQGIAPSREAEGHQLARRIAFDLTGLPPDRAAIEAASGPAEWYGPLVDRLLASKSHGEHQARFWLDLVRYAESDGYRADGKRPHATAYRDYVIRAFNEDLPYNRFITQQIAGDETEPDNRDAIVATMFLRHWIYEHNQRDVEQQWNEILHDVVETTADAFLAQGLKCARCHDHKFDPLLQADFYRMKAFFAPLQPREDMPVASAEARAAFEAKQRAYDEATEAIRAELYAIERPVLLAHATREGADKFIAEIKAMIVKREKDRSPHEKQIAGLAERQFDLHPDKLPEWLDAETETRRQYLRAELAKFDSMKPEPLPEQAHVASDVGPISPETVIPGKEGSPVDPGILSILDPEPLPIDPVDARLHSTGRRTTLAKWLTDRDNPLVARVIVNRVWQQHFGRGLCSNSSDFGRLGEPPSHPELLDWLASRLIEDGWSLKKLHRRIVSSATYRQSSLRAVDANLAQCDPENRLLWKQNGRRLAGEEIIDAMLTASGEIDELGRAIYLPVMRNSPETILAQFDAPDRIRSVGERHRTTTSMQALLMNNGPWTYSRAAALICRFEGVPDKRFIAELYQMLFARDASDEEVELAEAFLAEYSQQAAEVAQSGAAADHPAPPEEQTTNTAADPLAGVDASRIALTHALLNSSEMIYVD